jgi:hypothetical protein
MSTITQLHGMKRKHSTGPINVDTAIVTKLGPNFFSNLTADIWDLIAQYLIFNDIETEEEFIERTKRMSTVRNDKELSSEEIGAYQMKYTGINWHGYKESSLVKHYPKVNKIAVLQKQANRSSLSIVTTDTEQELSKIPFDSGRGCYYLIGSSDANLFATLHAEPDHKAMKSSRCEVMRYKDVLTIIDIDSQQRQEFVIPGYFSLPGFTGYPSAIAFKKEKTHVIVRGLDCSQLSGSDNRADANPIPHHLIITLTITAQKKSPEKKTLQHYFAQKRICKELK